MFIGTRSSATAEKQRVSYTGWLLRRLDLSVCISVWEDFQPGLIHGAHIIFLQGYRQAFETATALLSTFYPFFSCRN